MSDSNFLLEALQEFERKVVEAAKDNLQKKNMNVTGKLSESIKGEVNQMPNSIRVFFKLDNYGWFQDQGVKGVKGGSSLSNFSYKKSSNLIGMEYHTKTFQKWAAKRRIQRRDKKGKFLSYEQSGYAFASIVKNYGIKKSLWFTKPFEKAYNKLPDELIEKYGLDMENLLVSIIDESLKNK